MNTFKRLLFIPFMLVVIIGCVVRVISFESKTPQKMDYIIEKTSFFLLEEIRKLGKLGN